MNDQPLVSIIIPTYNRAHLIADTLNSIRAQTYQHWECIIVDDGSSDHTEQVVVGYAKKDKRFKFYHRPQEHLPGGNGARNYGYGLSQGVFVKWFDSDDIMKPLFLAEQVKIMLSPANLDFVACEHEFWYDCGKIEYFKVYKDVKGDPLEAFVLYKHFFITHAPLWKKVFLNGKDLFDESLIRGQETDFHFRMLCERPRYKVIGKSYFYVRRGHDSKASRAEVQPKYRVSQLKYYIKAISYLIENYPSEYKEVKEHLFTLVVSHYDIALRCKLEEEVKVDVYNIVRLINISLSTKFKLYLGFFLISNFGKGSALLNLKHLKHSSHAYID